MSRLIVEVCAVEEVMTHPNADRLDLARVKGWWCVIPRGRYALGDKVVYVPPDSVIPEALADRWGITNYCPPLGRDISGERPPGLRVRAARLRGVSSFGTLQDPDDQSWSIGTDVREHYGVTKYDPPVRSTDGDAATPVAAFHEYTSIEALGNFPTVFKDGEEVVVTEKVHGMNSRVGIVWHPAENGFIWQYMAGSHGTRRKEFNDKGVRSKYWFPLRPDADESSCSVRGLLRALAAHKATTSVILFGEIFGVGIQDMHYGQKGLAYRVFDMSVDGHYLGWESLEYFVRAHLGDTGLVPVLYRGPFSMAKMNELVDGPTTICAAADIQEPFKGREGIVIKPVEERFSPELGGRAILKFVSADYHARRNKGQTESH